MDAGADYALLGHAHVVASSYPRRSTTSACVGQAGLRDMVFSDDMNMEGSRMQLLSFFSLLERPDGLFPIVTP